MPSIEENKARWLASAHAVQTGVKLDQESGSQDGTPKHLRTGINMALVDHGSLVRLLVSKGVITEEEYFQAIADGMEQEVKNYEKRLSDKMGKEIHLA